MLPQSWIRALRWLAIICLFAWFVGAVLFVRADGQVTWHMPRAREPRAGEHNLALYELGPTIRASSYHRDVDSHHHPAFLVDGRDKPSPIEKWASALHDAAPWIEIRWREPRTLARVSVRHAGSVEDAELTVRRYRLICLSERPDAPALSVMDNEQPVAVHALACAEARGIRIEWVPNQPNDAVRVYEVQAWGE